MKVRRRLPLLLFALAALGMIAAPAVVSAHANLARSEPVAGSPNPVAPTEIRLWFTENPELRYSEIAVYDTTRQRYDQGTLRQLPGDPLLLAIDVRPLPEGIYTVAWKANSAVDGHTTVGSFAFAVGNLAPPASTGFGDLPADTSFAPPTPAEILTKWLTILAATAFVGALGLRLLVWLPALRQAGRPEAAPGSPLDRRIARRLILLAGVALVILTLGTILGLLLQAAKVTGRSFGGALDGAVLSDFLLNTRTGNIWSARLLLPIVAAMLLGPLLMAALRRDRATQDVADRDESADGDEAAGEEDALTPVAPPTLGVALGLAYLLTISLISHAAANPFWMPFTIAMDWLHLVGTAVWVGGLIGLLLTVPLVRDLGPALRPVLAPVVARFSTIALLSVGILAFTGLYSAWLHVGSLDALLPTVYGRALGVKLILFAGLLGLGAFNLLWLRPRLAAAPPRGGAARAEASAGDERTGAILSRRFGRALRVEVALGVAILLAVALLTSTVPAREAIAEARAPKRAQTITAGDLKLTMTLASLQPGENSYDLLIRDARSGATIADAERVALRLTHGEMDMGEAEALATPRGDGHYVASGPFFSMSGKWEVRAIIRRANVADVDQTFAFPIGSSVNLANTASALTAPQLPQLNSTRGIGFVAIGLSLILTWFGVGLFRRGSGFGTAMLMLVPTALVVGGYLIYNGQNEPASNRAIEPPNPVVADGGSITRGGALFAQNCVVCHGGNGQGDGPQAATLNPRPPNMAEQHTAYHTDGYLYNAILNGLPGSAMPAWGDTFTASQRWDLVNYLRQFNPLTANGATPPPVNRLPTQAPPSLPTVTPAIVGVATTRVAPAPTATPAPFGPAAPSSPPTQAPVGEGRLIHAFDGGIWATSPRGGPPTNMTADLARDAYAGDPALSPDGGTIAYTVVVVPAPGAAPSSAPRPALPGSDIWLMDAAGGKRRPLLLHDRAGVLIQSLAWSPDGRSLAYTYTAPVLGPDGRYLSSLKEVQRLDVATGTRATLVKDGQDPTFASSGGATPLAYVTLAPDTFAPSLWLAASDGLDARRLLGPEAKFLSISGPRFSPDGKMIVFAASIAGVADDPATPPSAAHRSAPERLARWLVAPFFPTSAAAHGPPADLWIVPLSGGTPRRLTNLNGDDPLPAWSPDGRRVAFLTGTGLYIINADGSDLVKITERGSYGSLIWASR